MHNISIRKLSKKFNNQLILDDINIDINSGELIALIGPSGGGKTTLLRIIAGLESADNGLILVDDVDLSTKTIKDRKIGFVFQHYALFNHMTIYDNIKFGLDIRSNELNYNQRVALARSIAVEPNILLLDEPFAALDLEVRCDLRRWIRRLHIDMNITTIFVTHDQEEAMEIADRLVIMNNGKIEEIGTASEIYHNPKNIFTYKFLGNVNIFNAVFDKEGNYIISNNLNQNKEIFVRPYDMAVSREIIDKNSINVKLIHINEAGPLIKLELQDNNHNIIQSTISYDEYNKLNLIKGDNIYTYPKKIVYF
ncbi:MAG: ATP-binding cassette domain-containing protein [Rickettsiales bacterium]|nr:MAG: ATP-binding cassette domain-containing protein [Rickettsiales bacterium]